nr:hypothetical protein [Tanacetum cinerariifolium]
MLQLVAKLVSILIMAGVEEPKTHATGDDNHINLEGDYHGDCRLCLNNNGLFVITTDGRHGYDDRQGYHVNAKIPNFLGNLNLEAVLGKRTMVEYTSDLLRLQARFILKESKELTGDSGSGMVKQVVAKKMKFNSYLKPIEPKCFRCSLSGHKSHECPKSSLNAYVKGNNEGEKGIYFCNALENIDVYAQVECEIVNLVGNDEENDRGDELVEDHMKQRGNIKQIDGGNDEENDRGDELVEDHMKQRGNIKQIDGYVLGEAHYDELYDHLSQFKPHVNASKAKKATRNHDPLALVANSHAHCSHSHASSSYSHSPQPYYVTHHSSVIDYEDDYQGETQKDTQEYKLTTTMMLLVRVITQHYSTLTNNRLHTSSNTRNQDMIHDGLDDIQSQNVGYVRNYNRNAGRTNKNQVANVGNGMVQQIEKYDQNVQRVPRTESTPGIQTFSATTAMEEDTMHVIVQNPEFAMKSTLGNRCC